MYNPYIIRINQHIIHGPFTDDEPLFITINHYPVEVSPLRHPWSPDAQSPRRHRSPKHIL